MSNAPSTAEEIEEALASMPAPVDVREVAPAKFAAFLVEMLWSEPEPEGSSDGVL